MNAKTQSTTDAPPGAPTKKRQCRNRCRVTMLMHRNFERLANLQKTTLDTLVTRRRTLRKPYEVNKNIPSGPAAAYCSKLPQRYGGMDRRAEDILDSGRPECARRAGHGGARRLCGSISSINSANSFNKALTGPRPRKKRYWTLLQSKTKRWPMHLPGPHRSDGRARRGNGTIHAPWLSHSHRQAKRVRRRRGQNGERSGCNQKLEANKGHILATGLPKRTSWVNLQQ